ncbi:hypothetical protein GGI15_004781 [Coemansia interrupta]|uniref:BZIP domain-containing protein n=1 Tax=Coemansia interrupta TaxID=1126814 RepID=A0A9W8H2T5_9FUNG|nr:hypothetical protein GGI15_004781 [Coemansia interrupta]
MDAFDSYINQSLIDNDGSVDIDSKPNVDFTNELYYQLLLSAVNNASPTTAVVPSDPSAAAISAAATIDPHNLTASSPVSVDGVSYMDTADSNALLTAALLSALGPLTSDINTATSMQGDDAMLVDSSEPNAASFNHPGAASDVAPKSTASTSVAPPASTKRAATASTAAPAASKQTPQRPVPSAVAAASAAAAARKRVPNPPPSAAANAAARRATTPSVTSNTKPSTASAYSAPRSLATPAPAPKAQSPDDALDDFDMEGVDISSLTPKERRQLRNKISARNFRVRRKEYITTLEAEVRLHKEESEGLRVELAASKRDNVQLREEINKLRLRINQLSVSQTSQTATANTASVATGPAANNAVTGPTQQTSITRPSMPAASAAQPSQAMPRFNPHKDIAQATAKKGGSTSATGSSASGGNWASKSSQSGYIAVNTAVMPDSLSATADQLLLEARRQQSVDALLSIGQSQQPISAPSFSLGDADVVAAALTAAGLVAELVMSQIAIESSLALAHMTAATAPALVGGVCCSAGWLASPLPN